MRGLLSITLTIMSQERANHNRLADQKSPYLLQHAANPVDWYPWGTEAFRAAKEEDKPIFLSIGYATCHWCHVMEEESFSNPEVARLMNETFINIKVDREELPEVDKLYMDFAQTMMAGAAGWPLNLILTPDLHPFFAATYLPPKSTRGMTGLQELVAKIGKLWTGGERSEVVAQADKIVEVFSLSEPAKGDAVPAPSLVDDSLELLYRMADPVYGGMKGAPKFPVGYQINLILRYGAMKGDSRGMFAANKSLEMMRRGGIYDQLGGGFSRYSVDEKWLIPHFEKMLYDNALLAFSYLEGGLITGKRDHLDTADSILHYVESQMTHPEGGFYSAEDADSEGVEGKFYTWTFDEVMNLLGPEEALRFCDLFGVSPEGNFNGRNVLFQAYQPEEYAGIKKEDPEKLKEEIESSKQRLLREREKRERPFKDKKVLVSWNGLMIDSMAQASAAMDRLKYRNLAVKAARFVKERLWIKGRLYRRWMDGEALHHAGLDEHAFLIKGLLSLFEAGGGAEWLEWAFELNAILLEQYKEKEGAYFQTDGHDPHLILRKQRFSDGAEPSGNAVQCENLLRLYRYTWDSAYLKQAEDILKSVKPLFETYAPGYSYHLMNCLRYYDESAPVYVAVLNEERENEPEIRRILFRQFLPHKSVIWKFPHDDTQLSKLLPPVAEQKCVDGRTTLYLCEKGVCREPLTDLNKIAEAVQGGK